MTVTNEEQTVQDFFNSIERGTYVSCGYNALVYVGEIYDSITDRYVPRVFNPYNFVVMDMSGSLDSLNRDNWKVLYENDGDENPRVVSAEVLRVYYEFCLNWQKLGVLNKKVHQLETKNLDLQDDWMTLNAHLNEYAENNQMCSDYERQLDTWNDTFSNMKLLGRPQDWSVGVVCPELWDGQAWISVRASSPGQANEMVTKMSTDELLRLVIAADSVTLKLQAEVTVSVKAH